MEYKAGEMAKLAGVSRRTLHHYDEVGLLKPARTSPAGYRLYGGAEVNRLQHILFYRELGLELAQIKALLDDPAFDEKSALESHLAELKQRRKRLDTLIDNAARTLQTLKGEYTMDDREKFEGFKQRMLEENEKKYGAEVREKYGESVVEEANKTFMSTTPQQHAQQEALTAQLHETLKAAVAQGDPAGELGQKAAALHKEWLCFYWPEYSKEAHVGLANMYVNDERFAAHYEAIAPSATRFLRDAVEIYCR